MMNDDMALVREYAASQSEQAFSTLVSRHVHLIHAAALLGIEKSVTFRSGRTLIDDDQRTPALIRIS